MAYIYDKKNVIERASKWMDKEGLNHTVFVERDFRSDHYRLQCDDFNHDAIEALIELLKSGRRWNTITRKDAIEEMNRKHEQEQ